MEKITRKPLSEIPSLKVLEDNWETWGAEFEAKLTAKPKYSFSWRGGIYSELRDQLSNQTQGHCSFCDGGPLGDTSKETIEHYEPKAQFPLKAYQWENLFYCCDFCQKKSNKTFEETLRPDSPDFRFDKYFYFDTQTGNVEIYENLSEEETKKADDFRKRYGINEEKRPQTRISTYKNVRSFILNNDEEDGRIRNDFPHRFVFDCVLSNLNAQSNIPQPSK